MCKESTELTVMRMAERLHPPVKRVDGASPHPSLLLQLFVFRAAKGHGPSLSGAMKSIKEEQQLISITKVFLYSLIATAACHMIS